MFSLGKKVAAALIGLVGIGFVVSGCGEFDVPSSATNGVENIRLFRDTRATLGPTCVEKVIKAKDGGTLTLNRHTIVIPPGALERDTRISISEPMPGYVLGDFGPDGIHFNKPVELSMTYQFIDLGGIQEDCLTIYWFNPETGTWFDLLAHVDKETQTVTLEVDHYSRYALSDH